MLPLASWCRHGGPAPQLPRPSPALLHRALPPQGRNSSSQMLDALEAAEAAFEQQEAAAEQQRALAHSCSQKGGAGAAAVAAAAAAAAPPPDTPRKAAIAPISEASGGRVSERRVGAAGSMHNLAAGKTRLPPRQPCCACMPCHAIMALHDGSMMPATPAPSRARASASSLPCTSRCRPTPGAAGGPVSCGSPATLFCSAALGRMSPASAAAPRCPQSHAYANPQTALHPRRRAAGTARSRRAA